MKFEHKILKTTHDHIVNINIKDDFFQGVFKNGGIIAGGFARWAVTPKCKILPNDIDIFCRTPEDFDRLQQYISTCGYIFFNSEFAISYRLNHRPWIKFKVQLIRPRQEGNIKTFGEPIDIIDNFDFTINMVAIAPEGVFMVHDFVRHMRGNLLVFNNIHCPIGILVRIRKYLRKGFNIYINEFIKVLSVWDELDATRKAEIISVLNGGLSSEETEPTNIGKIELEDGKFVLRDRDVDTINSRKDSPLFKIFYID